MNTRRWSPLLLLLGLGVAACGDDDEPPPGNGAGCDAVAQSGCESGQVCEVVLGGSPQCFAPLTVSGRVFDLVDDSGIEGARVVARDANDAAVSGVAVTAADGTYSLQVPAARDADGSPASADITLRADASGYLGFPKAPRSAIPVALADATGDPPTVQSAATDIGLLALQSTSGLGSISGRVDVADAAGTLVVAGAATGIADTSGEFVVFNVPAGAVTVQGYAPGHNLVPESVTVTAGAETADVLLERSGDATAVVSGGIQIVNPGDGNDTSIILVVESTFVPDAARGEAPAGLRAANVSGSYRIEGVPDGSYVVLGAFENDFLVRDPDTSIGGTEIQHITVAGSDVSVTSFKVTGAMAVVSPGAQGVDTVSGAVTFRWEDDSSEDSYLVKVFDAFGTLVWETNGVFDPGGSAPAEVAYGGPPLEAGMIYQFRAISIKAGVPISATEDLKGVFLYQ